MGRRLRQSHAQNEGQRVLQTGGMHPDPSPETLGSRISAAGSPLRFAQGHARISASSSNLSGRNILTLSRLPSDVAEAGNSPRAWQRHFHRSWQFPPEPACCKASRPERSPASLGLGRDVRWMFSEREVANCASFTMARAQVSFTKNISPPINTSVR